MALVRGVIAASIEVRVDVEGRGVDVDQLRRRRRGSASPPAVAVNVCVVVITSSPGPMPRASNARCNPAVAELTATQCSEASPRKAANSLSNRLAFGPVVIQPERSVSTTSAISSSPMSGIAKGRKGSLMRWASRSTPARACAARAAHSTQGRARMHSTYRSCHRRRERDTPVVAARPAETARGCGPPARRARRSCAGCRP